MHVSISQFGLFAKYVHLPGHVLKLEKSFINVGISVLKEYFNAEH